MSLLCGVPRWVLSSPQAETSYVKSLAFSANVLCVRAAVYRLEASHICGDLPHCPAVR